MTKTGRKPATPMNMSNHMLTWKDQNLDKNWESRRKYEKQLNQFQMDSPIGNHYTPIERTRIVAGKYTHVKESDASLMISPQQERHPLSLHQSDGLLQETTPRTYRAPPPPILPPEKDDNPTQSETNRLDLNPYPTLPPIDTARDQEMKLFDLYNMLPKYPAHMPNRPIQLNREEEMVLMKAVLKELRHLDPTKLKQVYMDLTAFDTELTGHALLNDINIALTKNNIFLPQQMLQLLAAMFMSAHEPSKINYEKVLSFLGTAIRTAGTDNNYQMINSSQYEHSPGHRTSYQQSYEEPNRLHRQLDTSRSNASSNNKSHAVYYEESIAGDSTGQGTSGAPIGTERDLPRTLRMLEEEMATHDRPVNFEALRLCFQRADRLLRGTLSREQLKQIVWDFRIPLRAAVLDAVITQCRYRGGGQYDWQDFVGFLERVTPQNTGLRIPSSKKPIEFAKHYPAPSSSWPHADGTAPAQSSPRGPPPPLQPEPLYRQPTPEPVTPPSPVRIARPSDHRPQPPVPRLPVPGVGEEPWFNRFMKLADALYRQDAESRGYLADEQVRRVVERYNSDYALRLDPTTIQMALNSTRGSSGRIDINAFLKRLAVRS